MPVLGFQVTLVNIIGVADQVRTPLRLVNKPELNRDPGWNDLPGFKKKAIQTLGSNLRYKMFENHFKDKSVRF
jgi:hypothetical protein